MPSPGDEWTAEQEVPIGIFDANGDRTGSAIGTLRRNPKGTVILRLKDHDRLPDGAQLALGGPPFPDVTPVSQLPEEPCPEAIEAAIDAIGARSKIRAALPDMLRAAYAAEREK